MLDQKRHLFKDIDRKIGELFSIFPITPNQWTLISIFFGLVTFYFLTKQNLVLAITFFLISAFIDSIDGAVARFRNICTKLGAFLDTICDRYVEGLLLLGMLFLPLPYIFLPPAFWLFLVLFGSIITTYAKAASKEKDMTEVALKGGLLSRAERIILLLIALLAGLINTNFYVTTYILITMAVLTNFTALQRIYSAIKLNLD